MLNESFETMPSYTMNAPAIPSTIHNNEYGDDDDDDVKWEYEDDDDDSSSNPGIVIVPPMPPSKSSNKKGDGSAVVVHDDDPFPGTTNMNLSLPESLPSDVGSVQEASQHPADPDTTSHASSSEEKPTDETPEIPPENEAAAPTPVTSEAATTPAPNASFARDLFDEASSAMGAPRNHLRLMYGAIWFLSIAPSLYLLAERQSSRHGTLHLEQEIQRLKLQSQLTQLQMESKREEDILRIREEFEKHSLAKQEIEKRADLLSEEQVRLVRQEAQQQLEASQAEKKALFEEEVRRIRIEAQEQVANIKAEKEMQLAAEINRFREEAAMQSEAVHAEKQKVLEEKILKVKREALNQAKQAEEESMRKLTEEIRRLQREARKKEEEENLRQESRTYDWMKFTWDDDSGEYAADTDTIVENCWLHAKANLGLGECGVDAAQKVKKELKRWGTSLWRAHENLFERWEDYGKKLHDFTSDVFKRNSTEEVVTDIARSDSSVQRTSNRKNLGLAAATVLASGVAYAAVANLISDGGSASLEDEDDDDYDFFFHLTP